MKTTIKNKSLQNRKLNIKNSSCGNSGCRLKFLFKDGDVRIIKAKIKRVK